MTDQMFGIGNAIKLGSFDPDELSIQIINCYDTNKYAVVIKEKKFLNTNKEPLHFFEIQATSISAAALRISNILGNFRNSYLTMRN